jgi:hypothetical protein
MSEVEPKIKSSENHKEYMKKYYQDNKDKFSEWTKKKIYCECCNKHITAPNYATHLKSTKHISNSEKKNINNIELSKTDLLKLLNMVINKDISSNITSIDSSK